MSVQKNEKTFERCLVRHPRGVGLMLAGEQPSWARGRAAAVTAFDAAEVWYFYNGRYHGTGGYTGTNFEEGPAISIGSLVTVSHRPCQF